MNTIAIDCGTSFVKAAVFDEKGNILKIRKETSPVVHGNEDILLPVQIDSLFPLVKKLFDELIVEIDEATLCISNEMHGFILTDNSGNPITDYISWQKEYGFECINGKTSLELLSTVEYEEDIKKCGMPLRAGLPSCNLLYLFQSNKPQKTNSTVYFYTLGDYLIKKITGVEPYCHPTNAAATGLYDIFSVTWNKKLIKAVGAELFVFPKVSEKKQTIKYRNKILHICPAVGDQQATLLGAGLRNESDLSFNLGTGAQVSVLTKTPELSKNWQIRPFFNDFYLKTIPHLPSGRALNVYIRFFKDVLKCFGFKVSDDNLWKVLLEQVNCCLDTKLECDLSFFQNPISDRIGGKISNIPEYGLTLGSLIKSVFQKMSQNFLFAAQIVQPQKEFVKRIVFSGGIAKRIDTIRNSIVTSYDSVKVAPLIEDETLLGLFFYGKLS